MKARLLVILLVIFVLALSGCQADAGLSAAFDMAQYDSYVTTTTICKNGDLIIKQSTTVEKLAGGYRETTTLRSLAAIDSDEQYVETTHIEEYTASEYSPNLIVDLSRLTVPQLSGVIEVDGVRKLTLDLTEEEAAVLCDGADEDKSQYVLTIIFDKEQDIMSSMTLSYATAHSNSVEITTQFG